MQQGAMLLPAGVLPSPFVRGKDARTGQKFRISPQYLSQFPFGVPPVSLSKNGTPVCRAEAAELYHRIHKSLLTHSSILGTITEAMIESEREAANGDMLTFIPRLRARRGLLDCGYTADSQLWQVLDTIIEEPHHFHSREKIAAFTLLEEIVFPRLGTKSRIDSFLTGLAA